MSFLFVSLIACTTLSAIPYPIQFSIPESKIVDAIPEKNRDFAILIPGIPETYIYDCESDYYEGYQQAYFAITQKKAGWDCLRHYEILANGCIPYFLKLDECDLNTMPFLPRQLIQEAMNLEGVSFLQIDHTKFDRAKYDEILNRLLDYTRQVLTTKQMARYLLSQVNYTGKGNILFLSHNILPDYLRETTLIGLKELFPDTVVDVPKVDFLYETYTGNIGKLYGKGMTYTKNLEDIPVNRDDIEQRIINREFDLIIYAKAHATLPYHDLVLQYYPPSQIVYICGLDAHRCELADWPNLFLREWSN